MASCLCHACLSGASSVASMGVILDQAFLQEKSGESRRMVREFAEDCIAKLFVETPRLELEGVEPGVAAAAGNGLLFSRVHELPAIAHPAQSLRHRQELNEEPSIARIAPQATLYRAPLILQGHHQPAIVAGTGLGVIVLNQRGGDAFAILVACDVSQGECEFHDWCGASGNSPVARKVNS